jgi:tyrosyl-DNA phosphodiesterase-1
MSSFHSHPDKMIIAVMRDEGHIGGKDKAKKVDYESDTDTDVDDDDDDDDDDVVEVKDEKVGWAYIGSHNFTPSAWGNLSGSSFNPILNVRALHRRSDYAYYQAD